MNDRKVNYRNFYIRSLQFYNRHFWMKHLTILSLILFFQVTVRAQHTDLLTNPSSGHFTPVWSGNPYLAMNFYITSATVNTTNLVAGDEIGVFDGINCVGAIVLTEPIPSGGYVQIIASTDDPNTTEINGFTPGDTVSYKFWLSDISREVADCSPIYTIGNGRFVSQGTALLTLISIIPIDLTSFTALIEGFYNGISMVQDTVIVELHSSSAPYVLVDQTKLVLNSVGQSTGKFYSATNGTAYYIVLKHRNALETWSASSQIVSGFTLAYDFTTASNKAYGNNLKQINGKWCIKGGDINQDGFVNFTDVNLLYPFNVSGTTGYTVTDLNGDSYTEIADLNIVFINYVLGVHKVSPP
jgi:hypothetical protein